MRCSKRNLKSETKAKKAVQRVLTTSQMWRLLRTRKVVKAMENFYSVREIEERNVPKPKTGDDQFKEMTH